MSISHNSATGSDVRIFRLKQTFGWGGYGVYWGLVELIEQQSSASVPADFGALAWALRVDEPETIRQIVEDFGLFNVDDDVIRVATAPKKQGELTFAQKGAIASAAKRKNKTTTDSTQDETTPQEAAASPIILSFDETIDNQTNGAASQEVETAVDETRDDWNEINDGTRAVVKNAIFSTAFERANVASARREFTRDEIKEAFAVARADNFNWQFCDAIKPDNIRRLLSKKDKQNAKNESNNRASPTDDVSFDAIFAERTGSLY